MAKQTDPLARLKAFIASHNGSRAAAASALGITQQYLGDLLNGRRTFSENILNRLGLTWVVVERKAS